MELRELGSKAAAKGAAEDQLDIIVRLRLALEKDFEGCLDSIQAEPERGLLLVQATQVAYVSYMTVSTPDLAVSEARQQLATIIDRARAEHVPIYLARRGRRVAAVIDSEDLERILELAEDMADIRAAEAARAEMRATGETPIPWEQVKADLGLA